MAKVPTLPVARQPGAAPRQMAALHLTGLHAVQSNDHLHASRSPPCCRTEAFLSAAGTGSPSTARQRWNAWLGSHKTWPGTALQLKGSSTSVFVEEVHSAGCLRGPSTHFQVTLGQLLAAPHEKHGQLVKQTLGEYYGGRPPCRASPCLAALSTLEEQA